MRKFKNVSGRSLKVYGFGIVKNEQVIERKEFFNNANFVEVFEEKKEEVKKK